MLKKLTRLITHYQASKLVFLGDLLHSNVSAADDFEAELKSWRNEHANLNLQLIKGNHDRWGRKLWQDLAVQLHEEPYHYGPLLLSHYPECRGEADFSLHLCGHLHPAIRLPERIDQRTRCVCFWLRGSKQQLVLPAFGEFTGTHLIHGEPQDQVWLCAEEHLVAWR